MGRTATKIVRLTGQVRDGVLAEPAPECVVVLSRDGQPFAKAVTDKAGEFEVEPEGLVAGRYGVEVLDATGSRVVTTEVDLGAGQPRVELVLPRGRTADGRHITFVEGLPVDLGATARLTREDLLDGYRALRGRADLRNRERLVLALPWLTERMDDCGTGRLEALRLLAAERGVSADEFDDLDDFEPGETVQDWFTASIHVRYTTTAGINAVDPATPAADTAFSMDGIALGTLRSSLAGAHPDNTVLAPTYVQKVALIAEYGLARFVSPAIGVRDPRNGAARMEYRILDCGGFAGQTSVSWSHVEVAPANSDNQNFGTVPHEMFHQVQYRYNSQPSSTGFNRALREGGARLAEDAVRDSRNRYVQSAKAWLDDPSRSLDPTNQVDPYAAGLLWKFLAEKHSTLVSAAHEPAIGFDQHRRVLEATANVAAGDPGLGAVPAALRNAIAAGPWYGDFDRFRYYDAAHAELDTHETAWGNFLVANFLHGTGAPAVGDARFDYLEDDEPAPALGAPLNTIAAVVDPSRDVTLAAGSIFPFAVTGRASWSAEYYRVRLGGMPAPRLLRVALTASAGMTDPLVQILRIGPGNTLVDLHRGDGPSYTKTISLAGLSEVVVIVARRATGGDYNLTLSEVAAGTDVMVTRWNTVGGREYEVNPRGGGWSWVSPDLMVDNNGDGLRDGQVFFDQDNVLKIRLRNRGNVAATGIQVDFWYQKATPFISAGAWIPMTDDGGNPSRVVGASLAAGASQWFPVNWAPRNDGTNHHHWCVKAVVTVVGDLNSDNKMVLSNFGNVVVPPAPDKFDFSLLLRAHDDLASVEALVLVRDPRWRFDVEMPKRPRPRRGRAFARRGELLPLETPPVVASFAKVTPKRVKLNERTPNRVAVSPIDPATLPPGGADLPLITIAQVLDGRVVGGVTYSIEERRR